MINFTGDCFAGDRLTCTVARGGRSGHGQGRAPGMTHERDIERLLDHWLSDGPTQSPDRVMDVVADRIERQHQRPAWRLNWRHPKMNSLRALSNAVWIPAAPMIRKKPSGTG